MKKILERFFDLLIMAAYESANADFPNEHRKGTQK